LANRWYGLCWPFYCRWLASSLSSYVSGSTVTVHGGGEKPAFLNAANTD
jgi:hypothetical protein